MKNQQLVATRRIQDLERRALSSPPGSTIVVGIYDEAAIDMCPSVLGIDLGPNRARQVIRQIAGREVDWGPETYVREPSDPALD
jgi:hypothetical protein